MYVLKIKCLIFDQMFNICLGPRKVWFLIGPMKIIINKAGVNLGGKLNSIQGIYMKNLDK